MWNDLLLVCEHETQTYSYCYFTHTHTHRLSDNEICLHSECVSVPRLWHFTPLASPEDLQPVEVELCLESAWIEDSYTSLNHLPLRCRATPGPAAVSYRLLLSSLVDIRCLFAGGGVSKPVKDVSCSFILHKANIKGRGASGQGRSCSLWSGEVKQLLRLEPREGEEAHRISSSCTGWIIRVREAGEEGGKRSTLGNTLKL